MKSFKSIAVLGAVLACVLLLLVTVRRYQGELQTSTETLRRYDSQLTDLKEENTTLSNKIASAADWKQHSDKDLVELMKLRAEVLQLRKQNKELQSARPRSVAGTNEPQPQAAPTQAVAPSGIPKESWEFAGYQTPANAFESLVWAMKNGDLNTFLASLSPEAQVEAAKTFQGMSDADIAARLQGEIAAMDTLPVDRVKNISDAEAAFVLSPAATDNGSVKARDEAVATFTNINGAWKSTGF